MKRCFFAYKPIVFLFVFSGMATCRNTTQKMSLSKGEKTPASIWTTEWSFDGKYVAVGGDDSLIWIYNGNDHRLYKVFASNSMVKGMSWHPKENLLAISNMNGVQLLDMKTELLKTVPAIKDGGRAIAWNHTGELLALGDHSGLVQVMDKQGRLIRSIRKHNHNSYLTIHWHPFRDIIVTGSDEIILFDTSGKQLAFIKHREENTGVLSARWHPSGRFFATGDYGHINEGKPTLLQFWKEDGTLIKSMYGHQAAIRNLRWSRDGSMVATASDSLRIWNKEGRLLYSGGSANNLWGVAWSQDDKFIMTGSGNSVQLWNNQAKPVKHITSP